MKISRTVRTLALVPMFGALSLSPGVASANQGEGKVSRRDGASHERTVSPRTAHIHIATSTSTGIRGLVEDKGMHRGWLRHNGAAGVWSSSVYAAIKKHDYSAFQITASTTVLGASTTEPIFSKLADASDAFDAGKHADALVISNDLKATGYNFKKLFRESLAKLFPKNSKGAAHT